MFPVTLTRLIVMITFCRDTLQGSPDPLRETEVSGLEQGTSHLYEKHVRTEQSDTYWPSTGEYLPSVHVRYGRRDI